MTAAKEPQDPLGTRERILDAAERLFGETGFNSTSLRRVTDEAKVNLAAVNYHFRSKEGLIEELFRLRVAPMNKQRLELLERYRKEAAPAPIPLERIIEAFMRPLFQTSVAGGKPDLIFINMLGRMFTESPELFDNLFKEHIKPAFNVFFEALQESMPDLDRRDISCRFHFALSLMVACVTQRRSPTYDLNQRCDPDDIDCMIAQLLSFICAGFRAPEQMAC